jgi:hypothetical protein
MYLALKNGTAIWFFGHSLSHAWYTKAIYKCSPNVLLWVSYLAKLRVSVSIEVYDMDLLAGKSFYYTIC